MFDHLLKENNLTEKLLLDYGLNQQDILFIKELMVGPIDEETGLASRVKVAAHDWPFKGRSEEKSFLYEIVANKISGEFLNFSKRKKNTTSSPAEFGSTLPTKKTQRRQIH